MIGRLSPRKVSTTLVNSEIEQPIDMQYRLQTTVQTHQSIAIAASGVGYGIGYVSTEGYDRLIAVLNSDSSTTNSADLSWSMDGVNEHFVDTAAIISNTSRQKRTAEVPVYAPWVRLKAVNGDAGGQHFFSCWLFLKV
jgi:hypothetical protein